MTKSYTAADGRTCPWPPPENWYLAADGRWWPPEAGPVGSAAATPADGAGRHDLTEVAPDHAPSRRSTRALLARLLAALLLIGLVAAVGVALWVGFGSDEDGAGGVETGLATGETVGADGAAAEGVAGGELSGGDEPVAAFRELAAGNGLVVDDSLSDGDIAGFGATFCVMAAGADDIAQFESLSSLVASNNRTELGTAELDVAVTAAIVSFCPDEAGRLGVRL